MKKDWLFVFVLMLSFACSSEKRDAQTEGSKIINPNGDSELALLMRDMYDENYIIKTSLLKGDMDLPIPDFSAMHTAEATEPEKASSDIYKSLSGAFLESVDQFNHAEKGQRYHKFNGMVDQCMGCHQMICPGPMRKIKKLYIPQNRLPKI